jgi:hypothetical protein
LHAWHTPAHAVLQQTPCAQNPDVHCVPIVQAAPFARLPQLLLAQVFGARQSADVEQVVRQLVLVVVSHRKGLHDDGVTGWQVPAPSQVRAGVNVDPVHAAATQGVPAAYSRQPPLPSQNPSVPQAAGPLSMHCPSGSCPTGTFVHVPGLPGSAHDWQVPVQALLQQTCCWQRPDAQSVPAVQAAPRSFFPQTPLLQTLGLTQSVSAVQLVRQAGAVVEQLNGAHDDGVGAWQVPLPSHDRGDASAEPLHVASAQLVPAAYSWQPPTPSQSPFVLQVDAPASAHWSSGSWPAGTGVHVPAAAASAQDMQVPLQAVWQQTFCAQMPEAHSDPVAHEAESGFLPQLAAVQTLPVVQSADVMQVVRHALGPPHT